MPRYLASEPCLDCRDACSTAALLQSVFWSIICFWVVKWFLLRINWILIGGWQKLIDGDASSGTKPDYHQDSLFLSNKVEICFYSIHFETINVNKLHREQRECKLNTKRQLQMHIDCQAMNWVLRKQNSFRIVPTHFSIQCTTCDLLLDTNKAKVFLLLPATAYFLEVLKHCILDVSKVSM